MALSPIVKGTRWSPLITVKPRDPTTEADLQALLPTAQLTASLRDSARATIAGATVTATLVSASNRTVRLTMTAAVTAALTEQEGTRLDLRITPSGGEAVAVKIDEAVSIRSAP